MKSTSAFITLLAVPGFSLEEHHMHIRGNVHLSRCDTFTIPVREMMDEEHFDKNNTKEAERRRQSQSSGQLVQRHHIRKGGDGVIKPMKCHKTIFGVEYEGEVLHPDVCTSLGHDFASVHLDNDNVSSFGDLLQNMVCCIQLPMTSSSETRSLFGGEGIIIGPFYHEDFTEEAMIKAGFELEVVDDIGWHADYVDSYLYNPLWWFKGVISSNPLFDRLKASLSNRPYLERMHFDDLGTADQVITMWLRYIRGCLIGLYWAAEIYEGVYFENLDPIGAAHNLIGVALHAMQDFYTHSNWIDAVERRGKSLFDFEVQELQNMFLYTGYYETKLSPKPHGKYSIICYLVTGESDLKNLLSIFLESYCGVSPNWKDLCMEYQDCDELKSQSGDIENDFGFTMPEGVLYYGSPGINLDTTWAAKVGVKVRGIDGELNGLEAFSVAKNLAIKGSVEFVQLMERILIKEGHEQFWNEVKNHVSTERREDQFELFNHFPFQFIGVGELPSVGEDDNDYFLRVVLKTSDDLFSGTDADIKLIADGTVFDLDYMKGENKLIAYNDFETGDEVVYTVGPFSEFPAEIELFNDAPNKDSVLEAMKNGIKDTFKSLGEAIKDFFLNQADYVGTISFVMEPSYLYAIPIGSSQQETVRIDGGDFEGRYDLKFDVQHTSEKTFVVNVLSIYCISESNDFGTSDEPWVQIRLDSYQNAKQSYQSEVFSDVDAGEIVDIDHAFLPVEFLSTGALVLSFRIWESDSESASERNESFKKFLESDEADEKIDGFFTQVGESTNVNWKLDWIKVYAFRRGEYLESGQVLFDDSGYWIGGSKKQSFVLNRQLMKSRQGFDGSCNPDGNECCSDIDCTDEDELCSVMKTCIDREVITFSEFPLNTLIKEQYSDRGVVFGGDKPFITTDSAQPTSPVLSGTPRFNGEIEGHFVDPITGMDSIVSAFEFDAGYFDEIGSTRLTWLDSSGQALGQTINKGYGIEKLRVEGGNIAAFRIGIFKTEPHGYSIDNFHSTVSTSSIVFREKCCDGKGDGFWGLFGDEIPGFDHVALNADGVVYESHPGYEGVYVSKNGAESIDATPISGVQQTHTLATFKHYSHEPWKTDVTDVDEVPIPHSVAVAMKEIISDSVGAGFSYLDLSSLEGIEKTLSPEAQKGGDGSFTCVGLVEYAAEKAGVNDGQGYIPDEFESFEVDGHTYPLISPQILYLFMQAGNLNTWLEGKKQWIAGFFDPVDFTLTDPLGRRLGFVNQTRYNEIPHAFLTPNGRIEHLIIWNTLPGNYKLEVFGIQDRKGFAALSSSSTEDFVKVDTDGTKSVRTVMVKSKVTVGSKGDVNTDGVLNDDDVQALEAKIPIFTESFDDPGDINSDGILDGTDVTLLKDLIQIVSTYAPPVAQCKSIVTKAVENCQAPANIDDGSFDTQDTNALIELSPSGPYDIGQTQVRLTITNKDGDSDSCEANVTVLDEEMVNPDYIACGHDGIIPSCETSSEITPTYSAPGKQALRKLNGCPVHLPQNSFVQHHFCKSCDENRKVLDPSCNAITEYSAAGDSVSVAVKKIEEDGSGTNPPTTPNPKPKQKSNKKDRSPKSKKSSKSLVTLDYFGYSVTFENMAGNSAVSIKKKRIPKPEPKSKSNKSKSSKPDAPKVGSKNAPDYFGYSVTFEDMAGNSATKECVICVEGCSGNKEQCGNWKVTDTFLCN